MPHAETHHHAADAPPAHTEEQQLDAEQAEFDGRAQERSHERMISAKRLRLERSKLVEKLLAHGREGVDFAVLDPIGGALVAVKLGLAVQHKAFVGDVAANVEAGRKGGVFPGWGEETMSKFVLPCIIHPDPGAARALFDRFPGALSEACSTLFLLYRGQAENLAGK